MKTSFYFILWIFIYPLLGLLHNEYIEERSFFIAAFIVVGIISPLIKRLMPKILAYERGAWSAVILEDVYTGNVVPFAKRLSSEAKIELFSAGYLVLGTVTFLFIGDSVVMLLIFGFLALAGVIRCVHLFKAKSRLDVDPSPAKCMEIANDTYGLDYEKYYEARNAGTFADMIPPRPRHYTAYRVVCMVFAVIVSLLGTFFVISTTTLLLALPTYGETALQSTALAGLIFSYGGLAILFGIKDFISCIQSGRAYRG